MQLTVFQKHKQDWKDCDRCPLHETRFKTALWRGKIPCDVLFVGEAPGRAEDVRGIPFVGPAGMLLDRMVANAVPPHYRVGFTNLLACIPIGEEGAKVTRPPPDSVEECRPRLEEVIWIAKPRIIFTVGDDPESYFKRGYRHSIQYDRSIFVETIQHPSWILQQNVAQQGLLRQKNEVVIAQAIEEMEDAAV